MNRDFKDEFDLINQEKRNKKYGCYTYYIDEDGDFMTTQKCRKGSHCYRNHEAEDFMYNRKIIRTRRFKNKA